MTDTHNSRYIRRIPEHPEMEYWRYLCNAGTRPECLRSQLVGDEEQRPVSLGDTILLYDYSENDVYGPMTALTESTKHLEKDAWRGRYPFQVRVSWDDLYRITSSRCPRIETNESLSRREFEQIVRLLRNDGDHLVLPEWGSPEAAYAGEAVAEPDDAQIAAAREELEAQLDAEPPDITSIEHTTVEQIARSEAFRQTVREAYDNRCAVCGTRRETPDGRPEVEAAHIRPKAKGGPDDIRNGIALCKLHHWAFDNGWLALVGDYRIAVTDAHERDGYSDFAALEGNQIELPEDPRKYPDQKYLEE